MFASLMIANRGEIACRVARTARRLGLRVVAVYSDADADARHVQSADEAYRLGPAPARESYLKADLIVDLARRHGVGAIHPGYGFLSENAAFARACAEAGIVFVGPPAAAIEAMGSKSGAKAIMEAAGVPLVPGYHGDDQGLDRLSDAAHAIGYPVLLKASAGGGGKGMRIVRSAADLPAALDSAKREAAASFGDDRMLVEKYLLRPRHVEVQVFADTHGAVLHLHDRDCSVQRRHQKVIEEAPAPGLSEDTREAMGRAAVAAARAIGYVGAGTVEFILDERGDFYFMEMNTRLQVEHPVTEMITGLDLVEWQLRVAAGEALPFGQEDIRRDGHAVEARLYAEDPQKGYLPSTGRLHHFRLPVEGARPSGAQVRTDTGVTAGDDISIHYDPMIAKLIVHAGDRTAALGALRQALSEVEIVGPTANTGLLAAVAGHPAFVAGPVDTGFLEREHDALLPESEAPESEFLVLAALAVVALDRMMARQRAAASDDPGSPWWRTDGWRLNGPADRTVHLAPAGGGKVFPIAIRDRGGELLVAIPVGAVAARIIDVSLETHEAAASGVGAVVLQSVIDGRRSWARVVFAAGEIAVFATGAVGTGAPARFVEVDPLASRADDDGDTGALTAPMPGRIVAVLGEVGTPVAKGTPLLVLEAMKMEHTIAAPTDGAVTAYRFKAGDLVSEGTILIDFDRSDP